VEQEVKIMAKTEDNRRQVPSDRQDSDRQVDGGLTRSLFLRRGVAALAGAAGLARLPVTCGSAPQITDNTTDRTTSLVKVKGGRKSRIKSWDVITIGNLSRNRYWGESDNRGVRSAICTCTLIRGDSFHVLVDPSLKDEKEMRSELDRRTGLSPSDIDAVFITHQHGDHHWGLVHFRRARWLAGATVAEGLNKSGRYQKSIEPAGRRLLDAIDVVPTPGHTMDHHSMRFDCDGLSVVVAGDSVPTRDFWRERRGYFNAVDFELSARTMDEISSVADMVVPGHDNYFLSRSAPF
jgi:glyoxylase-like metal-dependent hydrolase (beta-lactamase superfamily II)